MRQRWSRLVHGTLAAVLASAIAGCSSLGPKTVSRDRIDYLQGIANSWKEQTLLNIVRLRYGDMPVFLEVGQVIAGYQLQSTVGGGVTAGNFNASSIGPFTVSGGVAGQQTYTDRPTVIYAPLTGVDFLKKLMTPLPPSALLFLLQSRYNASVVLPLALDSVNGIRNESNRAVQQKADPRFHRVVTLLSDLQLAGGLQVRIESPKGGGETSMLVFGASPDPAVAAMRSELRRILGLRIDLKEIHVYYGGYSGKDDEIDLMTRSMLQIMLELAAVVEVPAADVAQGRASRGAEAGSGGPAPTSVPIRILSGEKAPGDAYVAVQYGHRWFWVADTDFRSKATFASVMLLFSISDTGVKGSAPVVTVPASP